MSHQSERIVIGVDPHKLSATIEVVDRDWSPLAVGHILDTSQN